MVGSPRVIRLEVVKYQCDESVFGSSSSGSSVWTGHYVRHPSTRCIKRNTRILKSRITRGPFRWKHTPFWRERAKREMREEQRMILVGEIDNAARISISLSTCRRVWSDWAALSQDVGCRTQRWGCPSLEPLNYSRFSKSSRRPLTNGDNLPTIAFLN